MIYVTVGTERFPFDRLIRAVDTLGDVLKGEDVFIQTGTGTFTPSFPHAPFIPFDEACDKIREARIVISHAGAGTLLMCANLGKVPIMMTRKRSFGEHIDDHQQMFANRMVERGRILLIDKAEELKESVLNYEALCRSLPQGSHLKEASLAQHLKEALKEIAK